MAKWGDVDFSELTNFAKNLEKVSNSDLIGRFISDFLLEMAMRADRKIKKTHTCRQDRSIKAKLESGKCTEDGE
ncbi:hypothetical protein [Paenibacillus larvae]|uniref:hypothetical protein n=1 Tax=Paenibacillus larvae TaxID=1464 RepID=UPI001EDE80B1|nr:hypothetical protein [Paenibacillus larvae]